MAQYQININLNGDVGSGEGKVSSSHDIGTDNKTDKKAIASTKALGKYVATQTIQPFIQQATNYIVSNVQLTTGSSQLQQKVDFGMQVVNAGVSAFKNAQAGALLTASMGLGGPVGLAIGLSLSVASIGMNIGFKQAQLNLKEKEEGHQIAYTQNRFGSAFNMSRRGE